MTDITLQNFESDLLQASLRQPVLLDIWAPWCGPCRTLGPVLDKLATAYGGRFLLAKLNSDDEPQIAAQLSQAFGVRSIPFCVLFDQGQPVDGFVGALPEAEIRAFLDRHLGPGADAEVSPVEAAPSSAAPDAEAALGRLRDAVAADPSNDTARFDYLRLLIESAAGRPERLREARAACPPAAQRVIPNPRLDAVGAWLDACEAAAHAPEEAALAAAIAADKRDFGARYALAQRHFAAGPGRFTQAMDELLEILMRDKTWNGELARKTYVAILELMYKPTAPAPRPVPAPAAARGTEPPKLELAGTVQVTAADPVIDQYRRRLSMVLF